jgi:hypothetical protein
MAAGIQQGQEGGIVGGQADPHTYATLLVDDFELFRANDPLLHGAILARSEERDKV